MITAIIFIVISIAAILGGVYIRYQCLFILRTGVETEGIVYDTENTTFNNSAISFPVIRFITHKSEWITETYKIGGFPGFYKQGKKVKIVYLPDEPKKFIIISKLTQLVPLLITFFGLIFLIIGVSLLFSI